MIEGRHWLIAGAVLAASGAISGWAAEPSSQSSASPGFSHANEISPERMYELAYGLGQAKNRQDVEAALTFMHDDIVLTSPAWGAEAHGKEENAALLTFFFNNYPDYEVSFEDYVADDTHFVGWGVVRMTMAKGATDAEGSIPNGRRIEAPVTIRMTFKDDLIATEHFMIDLAQIAGQSGVSIDQVWKNVFGTSPIHTTNED